MRVRTHSLSRREPFHLPSVSQPPSLGKEREEWVLVSVKSNGHGKLLPLIMKLAIPVSPYPTFPRKREKGQTNRCACFTLMDGPG